MTILCGTCHTHVENPCKYTYNCKDFKKRMDNEQQAHIDEQKRIYDMLEESRRKMLNESRRIYISEIPDTLNDRYINVETILRFVKGENLQMYEQLIEYFNASSTNLITIPNT
jgi:hypothetical protein